MAPVVLITVYLLMTNIVGAPAVALPIADHDAPKKTTPMLECTFGGQNKLDAFNPNPEQDRFANRLMEIVMEFRQAPNANPADLANLTDQLFGKATGQQKIFIEVPSRAVVKSQHVPNFCEIFCGELAKKNVTIATIQSVKDADPTKLFVVLKKHKCALAVLAVVWIMMVASITLLMIVRFKECCNATNKHSIAVLKKAKETRARMMRKGLVVSETV